MLSVGTGACWSPPSPCAGGWAGLASSRVLSDGRTGAELLLCALGGAVNVLAGRTGAPVRVPVPSVGVIVLSLSTGCIEMFLYGNSLRPQIAVSPRVYLENRVSHIYYLYIFFALFLLHFFLFATDMENDNKSPSNTTHLKVGFFFSSFWE